MIHNPIYSKKGIVFTGIEVTEYPNNIEYLVGESFDPTGMVVTAIYSNGAKRVVTDYTYSPTGPLAESNNSINISFTEDGKTGTASLGIIVEKLSVAIPAPSGTVTYNGNSQSPTWSNYDPDLMSITGNVSGINAGTYQVVFSLNNTVGTQWSDGSLTDKTVSWTINKAAGSLSISPTSITLNDSNKVRTITVTRPGDGAIIATISNNSIATVQVNGNVITVTGKGNSGNATITVKVGAGTNYTAPANKTCSVSATYISVGDVITLTAASGTWVCPISGNWKLEMHGGGGGGGGGFSGYFDENARHAIGGMGAGGGGSGQMYNSVSFTQGQSIAYTIGRGGYGASARHDFSDFAAYENDRTGLSGSTGGTTTFGDYSVAGGGGGGGCEKSTMGRGAQCKSGTASGNLATNGVGYYRGWWGEEGDTSGISEGNGSTPMNAGGDGGGVGTYGDGGAGGIGVGDPNDPFFSDGDDPWDDKRGESGKNGAIILTYLG